MALTREIGEDLRERVGNSESSLKVCWVERVSRTADGDAL